MFDLEMFVVFISLVNESFVFSKKKKNKACVCVYVCGVGRMVGWAVIPKGAWPLWGS